MPAWLRKITPFEYVVGIVAILTIVFWRDPVAPVFEGKPSYFILLHGLALLIGFVLGTRALFVHDQMFSAFQWFGFFGAGIVPTIMLMGVHGLASIVPSMKVMALGWVVAALTALVFALPRMRGHKSLRYPDRKQRLLRIAPFALACMIGALVMLLIPKPTYSASESPYRAWFPREAG